MLSSRVSSATRTRFKIISQNGCKSTKAEDGLVQTADQSEHACWFRPIYIPNPLSNLRSITNNPLPKVGWVLIPFHSLTIWRFPRWRLALHPVLDPLDDVLGELLEVLDAGDVLAVLGVVLQTVLEAVQGQHAEVVHVAVKGFADSILRKKIFLNEF